MEEIRGPAGRTMWDKLGNVHEAVLANFLKNEYPQTVAVVLSKVKPDHARARALDAAGSLRDGSHHAHAAHGIGAEGRPGRRRAHAAQRVHEQPRAHLAARRARDDRRDLQQPRPRVRIALPDRARGAQPRFRREGPLAHVHLRGPGQARSGRRADAAAQRRKGQAAARASRARRRRCATCSCPTCRSARRRC